MGSKKIRIHKNLFQFLLVGFFVSLSFIIGNSSLAAGIPDFVTDIIAWIAIRLVELFGYIFVWFVDILIDIAQFNKFTNLAMVETGWGLARDVANMFFIVVLLIIAFSTVLKISSYHYQKTLGKLIIMAVLINFSKLIAGFLIDFFQVIMLTFVNGFKEAAAGNIATGFGMYDILAKSSAASDTTGTESSDVALAAVLALIMIVVADMIVLILIAVLMWRVAMLWILVIISPLAYLSYSFIPKYWSQWWQEFFKHLVSGPVIAFFLWLALLTMQQGNIGSDFVVNDQKETIKEYDFVGSKVNNTTLINYFVATALLLGGLAISQKIAAQSGGAVGNFAQKVQKYGTRAAMIGTGAAAVGYLAKKGVKEGVPLAYDFASRKLNIATGGRTGWITNPIKNFRMLRAQQGIEKEQEERLSRQMSSARLQEGGPMAVAYGLGSPDLASNLKGFLGYKYFKNVIGHKASTNKKQFEEVENKINNAEYYTDLGNRKNKNESYIDDKKQEADMYGGDVEEKFDSYGNHLAKVKNLQKEGQSADIAIKKKSEEIEKYGKKDGKSEDEIKKSINEDLEIQELRKISAEKKANASTIENSEEWKQEKKRLAVEALGYDEARKQGIVDITETVKDKDGNDIKYAETAFYKNENKQNEFKTLEKLVKDSKDLPDKPKKRAEDQLNKEADEHFEKKLKEKQEERDRLKEGGISEGERKIRKEEAKTIESKIKLAQADLNNYKNDPVQTQRIKELISALESNKKALLSQISAKTPEEIKAAFKQGDIDKNKEDNKKQIENIDKEIAVIEHTQKFPKLSVADRDKYNKQAEQLRGEAEVLKSKAEDYASYLPQAYYGRQQGRIAIAEEKKKIDTSNEDELIALQISALRNNNVHQVQAVAARAAEVGHLNEVIQAIKATKDITRKKADGSVETIVKSGEYLPSGIEGLHAYTDEVLKNQLGLNDQIALAFENDLSDIAQDVGHWTFAQAMGVQGGQFVQRSRDEQQVAVSIEKSKQDFENLMRRTNRLGWMTEKWADPKVGSSSGRVSILNAEAIEAIRTNFKAMDSSISKQRFNPNLALNLTTSLNMKILDEIGRSLPKIERKEWSHFMNNLLEYQNKTREEAYTTRSTGKGQANKIEIAKKIFNITGINY